MKNIKSILLITTLSSLLLMGCQKNESNEDIDNSVDVTQDELVEEDIDQKEEEEMKENIHIDKIMLSHNIDERRTIALSEPDAYERYLDGVLSEEDIESMTKQLNNLLDEVVDLQSNQLEKEPYLLSLTEKEEDVTFQDIEIRDEDPTSYDQGMYDTSDRTEYSKLMVINKDVNKRYRKTYNMSDNYIHENIAKVNDEIDNLAVGDKFTIHPQYILYENDQYQVSYMPSIKLTPSIIESEEDLINVQKYIEYFKTDDMIEIYEKYLTP